MDWTQIIIALIPAIASIITVVITSSRTNKKVSENITESKIADQKMLILQLINYDYTKVLMGKVPSNKEKVLHEFDLYTKAGGNSYIADEVEEYKVWYKENKGV